MEYTSENREHNLDDVKPLLSYVILSYNQEKYIEAAIDSALNQTYNPLEIIISDDCSTDNTFSVIKTAVSNYKGPHKIIVNQTDKNLGVSVHFYRAFSLCKGNLIIECGGDDISLPDRALKIYKAYAESGFKARAIYSDFYYLKGDNLTDGNYAKGITQASARDILKGKFGPMGCVSCYEREVFTRFEPPANTPIEDMVLGFRAALLGPVIIIPEKLVKYRREQGAVGVKYGNINGSFEEKKEFLSEFISVFLQGELAMLKDYLSFIGRFKNEAHNDFIDLLSKRIYIKLALLEILKGRNLFIVLMRSIKSLLKGVSVKAIVDIMKLLLVNPHHDSYREP